MARPPRNEPLSTDALSDPVSLGGTRVRREREGHTMGAGRTVAQTTESNGKEAAGKIVRPHAAAPRRGKAGQSEAAGPNAGPAFQPHPGYPPILALCSSDRKSIGHGGAAGQTNGVRTHPAAALGCREISRWPNLGTPPLEGCRSLFSPPGHLNFEIAGPCAESTALGEAGASQRWTAG